MTTEDKDALRQLLMVQLGLKMFLLSHEDEREDLGDPQELSGEAQIFNQQYMELLSPEAKELWLGFVHNHEECLDAFLLNLKDSNEQQ